MPSTPDGPAAGLASRALAGDRVGVARLITLVENGGPVLAEVMALLFPHTGGAWVTGVTGAPGAGKSTLVEGLIVCARKGGARVGVLAVDPTSPFSGGALLGDRVRMQGHATDHQVFIRSMAARGHLGGLALAAPDAVRVLEAWGAAEVLIETVGVGQSEVEVMDTADTVVVVVNPGWGDGVQANKAGLLEIADIFVVNKADRPGTADTVRELSRMLDLGPHRAWRPPILQTVGTAGTGIDDLWAAVAEHRAHLEGGGGLADRRRHRLGVEVTRLATERERTRLSSDAGELAPLVERVYHRQLDPQAAATELLRRLEVHGT